jgi:HAD superfamily 5'-nucleotidase-like hydrolase
MLKRNVLQIWSNLYKQYSTEAIKKEKLVQTYDRLKLECSQIVDSSSINNQLQNPKGVFCNNEIDLKDIKVYGFDFDYTLAHYDVSLYRLIFDLARDSLILTYKYPNQLKNLDYLAHFPIRGLHLDKRKGWFMKIDSYHNVQFDTVYHGMNLVESEHLLKFYGGTRLNVEQIIDYSQKNPTFHHYADLFCLPEISLLTVVFQYFIDNRIHFTPEFIFQGMFTNIYVFIYLYPFNCN